MNTALCYIDLGQLRRPKAIPCQEKESCWNCKKVSENDIESFDKKARQRNLRYFSYTKKFLSNCFEQINLANQKVRKEELSKMLNEIEKQYQEIEQEIEKITREAKAKILSKDLDELYGSIDVLYSSDTFGNKHYEDDPLIRKVWKEKILEIETFFYELADHIDVYDSCRYINRDFGKLLIPKNAANGWKFSPYESAKPCDEENYCKKCLNLQI